MNTIQYKLIAQDRKANPALRCLAMDVLEDMEKLDEEVKKKFIKPLSTENPLIEKMGLGISEYPMLGKEKLLKGDLEKIYGKGSPPRKPSFKGWLVYQKVKLKPSDKRYSRYYQRYKREMNKEGRV